MPISSLRRRISIRDLESFVAVASALSFSKASEALHISQPSLSATIRNLEDAIDARLFDRHTRSVELTAVGRELLVLAQQLLSNYDHAFARLEDFLRGKEGTLTIAASPSVMASFLPAAMRRFSHDHPRVDVKLYEEVYEEGIESLRAQKVEVVLTPRMPAAADLVQYELFEDRLVLVCRTDHPLAASDAVRWMQIAAYDQIALRAASNVRQLIDQEHARQGLTARPVYEVDRVSSMVGFISAGMGIGILPQSLFRAYDRSTVTCRPIRDGQVSRTICASHLKEATLSPAAKSFIALCIEVGSGSRSTAGHP